jgi:hypothetical protein
MPVTSAAHENWRGHLMTSKASLDGLDSRSQLGEFRWPPVVGFQVALVHSIDVAVLTTHPHP